MPVFLLGGGSNLLVSDDSLRGMVIHNACERVEFDGTAAFVEGGADYLEFIGRLPRPRSPSSRTPQASQTRWAARCTATPAAYSQDIGARVIGCTVATLDGASVETHPAPWFEFAYRDTRLKREPRVILSCLLQLERATVPRSSARWTRSSRSVA